MKLQRVIMMKMSGDDVKYMQSKLKDLGFHKGRVDGNYGQDTLVSVVNFQKEMGLKSDGVVSLQTWSQIVNFDKKQVNQNVDIPFSVSYVGSDGLKIYDSNLTDGFYYDNKTKKNTIWVKNTLSLSKPDYLNRWELAFDRDKEGQIKLDENNNTIKLKTSTHYTIGGFYKDDTIWDGKVIRNFDDKFWSYHSPFISNIEIGQRPFSNLSPLNDTKKINSMSVSIEICNLGPLVSKDGLFYTKNGIQVSDAEVLELDFMGYKYWNRYTNNQIESLGKLLSHLINKWNMEIEKIDYNEDWFKYHKKWNSVDGIRTDSQVSFERFGLFPQKEIIEMLNNL